MNETHEEVEIGEEGECPRPKPVSRWSMPVYENFSKKIASTRNWIFDG